MKVLIVGCGNSDLSRELYDMGVVNITAIDFSKTVINQMKDTYADRDAMTWHHMDVLNMDPELIPEDHYDIVIDKACFDACISSPGSKRNADIFLSSVSKVIKPQGVFIHVTFAQPHQRLRLLQVSGYKWEVSFDKQGIPKPTIDGSVSDKSGDKHFVYICKKQF